jgi:D-amino-acid oxidase
VKECGVEILVIGGGVSGLSTGIRLIEAGHQVRIVTRDLPPETTSHIAAAVWYPYKAYPEDLVLRWSAETYAELVRLIEAPESGVIMRGGIELFHTPMPDPWWRSAVEGFRRAEAHELPPGFAAGFVFRSPVIEMPIYLSYLLGRFTALGGRIEQRAITIDAALDQAEALVDCAGLGARELVGDQSMVPIRGQIVRVGQVGLDRFIFDDYGPRGVTYIVPRATDIILGGTAQEGNEDLTPDPPTAQGILERCIALEPRLAGAPILQHRVGLRPGRPTVRLELERRARGRRLVHNYGHGGAGVTLSWGCADAVVALLSSTDAPPQAPGT